MGLPFINLTETNPTCALADYPHMAVARAFGNLTDFTYRPDSCGTLKAREAISAYYATREITVGPEHLFLTASTSEAYTCLFKLLCDPGEAVLSPVPSYPLFEHLAAISSVGMKPYRLLYDGAWHIDFEHLRSQICPRTRAIVLVNPNNPTGHFLGVHDRQSLVAIAAEFQLPLISDEVFLDYPIDLNCRATRTMIGSPVIPVFAMSGLSKLAGMPQMKLAWTALSGPSKYCGEAMARLALMGDTYLSVATPVQEALPELLQAGETIRIAISKQVRANWQILNTALEETAANAYHLEGGWSAIVRLPGTMSEEEWVLRLLDNFGVIAQPGYYFDIIGGEHIVISLLTAPVEFTRGLEALREMLAATQY